MGLENKDVIDLHKEINNLKSRLSFIGEDVKSAFEHIHELSINYDQLDSRGCTLNNLLTNIEVATDLSDDTVECWKHKRYNN